MCREGLIKTRNFAGGAFALAVLLAPAFAADDDTLTRMALCKDSWFDWQKSEPEKLKEFGNHFRAGFVHHDNSAYFTPTAKVSALGFNILQAFPDSVGMGVGFSLSVDATFEDGRKALETALGKRLQKCETGDGMKGCELQLAPQRSITLAADDKPGSKHTLIGCYYFYEK